MKKYYIFYYFVLFLVCSLIFFIWVNKDKLFVKIPSKAVEQIKKQNNVLDLSELLYKKFKSIANNLKTEKDFSKRFCELVLQSDIMRTFLFSEGTIKLYIDPSCSVWLYNFCKSFNLSNIDNLKIKNFVKKGNLHYHGDEIDRASGIFSDLMNDYFNLKLATFFSDFGNKNVEDSIKIFSDKYFGRGKDLGCDQGYYLDNKYRFPDGIFDKKSICGHPLTYRYLFNVFKEYHLVGSNLNLVNSDYSEVDCIIVKEGFSKEELTDKNDMLYFYNLLVNEYFWYSLYMNLYKFVLHAKAFGISFDMGQIHYNQKFSIVSSDYVDKIDKINTYLILNRKAINYSIRIINNVYWTYPLHIALLAYFEELIYFRKYFVTIFTPFHQLYYKLRNVEDLDR